MKMHTTRDIYAALDSFLQNYNKAGFCVKTIYCDREFRVLMDPVKDNLDIDLNYTSSNKHVPDAEQNNRTIGERIRATYNNLPYKKIPYVMLKYLAMVAT